MKKRQKILLVDDETGIMPNLSAFLERSGFDTSAASYGEEALQQGEAVEPDLRVQPGSLCDLEHTTGTGAAHPGNRR